MRRRKLLISIGALGAGGAAAFGTEAFTSIEAERSVDVSVAGDANAYLAIEPLQGNNANEYVTTEDDGTVALEFDGDDSTSGGGVNQDAVTQIEDLFKIVNQGTQKTSVYFEDDSDAVTFRVTRSSDTETNGTHGQSLEGPDNAVELDVGEQVVVGLTIDTLNYDVSGSLVDTVTVVADAGATAPQQGIAEPQYVVDGTGDSPNTFETLSAALGSTDVSDGSVIGIEGSASITESSQVVIDKSVTVTGFEGTPSIDATAFSSDGGAIQVDADDVTLKNFSLTYSDDGSGATNGIQAGQGGYNGLTVDGLQVTNDNVTGQPAINVEDVSDVTITNNTISGGAIGVYYPSGAAAGETVVSGNYVNANPNSSDNVTEGIFIYGDGLPNKDLGIRDNLVENEGSGSTEIKVGAGSSPVQTANSVNGKSGIESQLRSVLSENNVFTAQVDAETGTKVTAQSNPFGTSLQDAIDAANSLTLVDSGTFSPGSDLVVGSKSLVGGSGPAGVVEMDGSNGRIETAANAAIRDLQIDLVNGGVIYASDGTGLELRGNTVSISGTSSHGIRFENGSNAVIANNEFDQAAVPSGSSNRPQAVLISDGSAVTVEQNKFLGQSSGEAVLVVNQDGTTTEDIDILNNEIRGWSIGVTLYENNDDILNVDIKSNDIGNTANSRIVLNDPTGSDGIADVNGADTPSNQKSALQNDNELNGGTVTVDGY